jgi:hypothetical protein
MLSNNLSDDNAYLLEFKTLNIFNSNVSKVYLFKTKEDAYNFAVKLEPTIKKYNICNIVDAIQIATIWESNPSIFPRYVCEIKKINNDIIQSLSNSIINEGSYIMNSLYKNLKINNIIV